MAHAIYIPSLQAHFMPTYSPTSKRFVLWAWTFCFLPDFHEWYPCSRVRKMSMRRARRQMRLQARTFLTNRNLPLLTPVKLPDTWSMTGIPTEMAPKITFLKTQRTCFLALYRCKTGLESRGLISSRQ